MIVDIGGGTTDVAVISLGSIVVSDSLKLAGNKIDEAIIKYIRRKYDVLIGEVTAEEIKKKLGAAWPFDNKYALNVKGRCLKEGLPKMITIDSDEVREAVTPVAKAIVDAICHVLERTPPELVGDISANGIILTGGGSLIYGMDRLIEDACGIKTFIAENPTTCVVIGTGRSLDNMQVLPEGIINISRQRQERL